MAGTTGLGAYGIPAGAAWGGAAGGMPAQIMAQSGAARGAPALLARAHHGSVSKEQRALIEEDLKAGRLPAVVATSSLELGIDMGAVDPVSYTHLRAHETVLDLVCRLLLEKKKTSLHESVQP